MTPLPRCEAYEPEPGGTVIYRCTRAAQEILPDRRSVCHRHGRMAREAATAARQIRTGVESR